MVWGRGVEEGKCHTQNLKCQQHPVAVVMLTDLDNLNADNCTVWKLLRQSTVVCAFKQKQ